MSDEAYLQPCVSPIWDTGLAAHALLETGDDEALQRVAKGLQWLETEAGARRARRLDRAPAECAARRLGVPIRQSALSRRRRHRGGGAGDGSRAGPRPEDRSPHGDRTRAGMDPGIAEPERRLGRIRCRQRIPLPQQHSVRRPRRAARSTDRGRHRALRVDAGAARPDAAELTRGGGCGGLSQAHAASPRAAGTAAGA